MSRIAQEGTSPFPLEDQLRMEKSLQIYDKIVDSVMEKGVPKDKEDRQFLLDALGASNKVILGKAKIKTDSKAVDQAKAASELAAEIMTRIGRNERQKIDNGQVEDAVIVHRGPPKLEGTIPAVKTVPDETYIGTQHLRYDDFQGQI